MLIKYCLYAAAQRLILILIDLVKINFAVSDHIISCERKLLQHFQKYTVLLSVSFVAHW